MGIWVGKAVYAIDLFSKLTTINVPLSVGSLPYLPHNDKYTDTNDLGMARVDDPD